MQINQHVNELLLRPLLRRDLEIPIDDFKLETESGPIALGAIVVCKLCYSELRLELRDSEGRDLSQFFTRKKAYKKEDLSFGAGTVGGKLKIQLIGICPPDSHTNSPTGPVQDSSASTGFQRIEIPVEGFEQFSAKQLASLMEQADQGKTDLVVEPDNVPPEKWTEFEHLAVFANCKLVFKNAGVSSTEEHGFWGKSSCSKLISWDGEVFGGEFSFMQDGGSVKVGFRHHAHSLDESTRCAQSLFAAFGYIHAINPWPNYIKVSENGRVLKECLRFVDQAQGKYTPLRQRQGHENPSAPTRLIVSVANWLNSLREDEREDIVHAFWVFRGADDRDVPVPAKLVMIGGVIEGLLTGCDSASPPEAFKALQLEAVMWAEEIESDEGSSERAGFARRLVGYLKNWPFRDRRVAWKDTFAPIFPYREDWLDEVFQLYNDHRHKPAHGDFAATMAGDSVELLRALGRLSGFVNTVVAAKAGYKGPILESTSSDSVIQLE